MKKSKTVNQLNPLEMGKVAASFIPPKSFLSSSTLQGISFLFLFELFEIFTEGAVNKVVKLLLLFAGTAYAAKGRWTAFQPLQLKFPELSLWRDRPLVEDAVEENGELDQAPEKVEEIEEIQNQDEN